MENKINSLLSTTISKTEALLRRSLLALALVLATSTSLMAVQAGFSNAFKGIGNTYSVESSSIIINAPFAASDFKFTSLNAADTEFTGNNVEGYFSYVTGGNTITLRGIISRKVGSQNPEAFYFAVVDNAGLATGDAFLLISPDFFSAFPGTSQIEQQVNSAPIATALNSILPDGGPIINGPGAATGATSFISIPELTTAIWTFTSDKTVTWSFAGGADQARFNIDENTGTITFKLPPNYEVPTDANNNNTYIVVLKATDEDDNETVQTLTVTVTNLNDAPTNLSLTPTFIFEKNAVGATVVL